MISHTRKPSYDTALVNQSDDDKTVSSTKLNADNSNTTTINNDSHTVASSNNDDSLPSSTKSTFQKFKNYLYRRVLSEENTVRSFQRYFGVISKHEQASKLWHYIFLFSAELGNEAMFASFLPFIFWHLDKHLGIRIVLIWAIVAGVGQFVKELFQLPRPNLETRLESCYESEYGFPSTHASGSMALSITFFGYILNNYAIENIYVEWSFKIAIVLWIVMCCLSRLYLGVHSPTDIYGGLFIGSVMLIILNRYLFDFVEPYMLSDSLMVPISIILITALLLWLYKGSLESLNEWRSSYGDTTRIFGACCGAMVGTWATIYAYKPEYVCAKLRGDTSLAALNLSQLTPQDYLFIAVTSVIGIVWILLNKEIARRGCFLLMKLFYLSSEEAAKGMKALMNSRYDVEIPIIFVTYTVIGITSCFLVPVFIVGKL